MGRGPNIYGRRMLGIAFFALGSLVALVGLLWVIHTAWFLRNTARAPGKVIALDRTQSSKGAPMFHPVFSFTDASGTIHTQRSSFGFSSPPVTPGQAVTILYPPGEPKRSHIDSFQTTWLGPLFLAVFGFFFAAFAAFWLRLCNRTRQF